ncbi:MAG: hypothetical protein IPH77_14900 [Ignavibacteria bacterium]|nr:hypothetical protein [Ignavibacteria bacterium]
MKKLFMIVLLFFVTYLQSFSQWTNNTVTNTVISNPTGDQATPKIAITSDGGSYITWFDNRAGSYAVYLQKLDKYGIAQFQNNGLLISSNPQSSSLQDFNIDVDGSDNAVIVFTDQRNGTTLNPFAYLISPSGVFLWGANGVSLTDSTTISQNVPVVAATSDGNYVFAWTYSSSPRRIAYQKLNSAGLPQWGSAPVKMRGTGSENFEYARLVKSDAGSVIMSWDAYSGSIVTSSSIKLFTQKLSSTNTKLWTIPQDTVQNLGRLAGISYIPTLVSDGQDGAVYTWVDDRDINSRQSAWVQRFNSSGVAQFPKNGSEGSTLSTNNHFLPSSSYCPSTGETFTFWTETNGGQTVVGGLYGQKFNSSGAQQWGSSGKEFKSLDNNQLSFLSVYTKDTNVVVTYTELLFGSSNYLVKAMSTGPSSEFHWPGNIVTCASFLSNKLRRQTGFDKNSGMAVMTWSDTRSGSGDILAQNLNMDGTMGLSQQVLNVTLGIEGMWNGSAQVQDTVRFYLRNNSAPFGVVDSAKLYLNTSGNGVAVFLNAAPGTYYIQAIHRNALETWSSSAQVFASGSAVVYDFTSSQSQTYGNNSILKSGRYCSYSGDIVKDGTVDASDLSEADNDVLNAVSGYVRTDVTGDNFVDAQDLSIVDNNATNSVSVITP